MFNGIHCEGKKVYSRKDRARYRERLHGRLGNLNLLDLHYRNMDFCRDRKAEHIRVLRKVAEGFQEEVQRLRTIPGIGPIGAYTVVAYLEDGWRIPNKRRVWQYCGIGIRRHESAGKGHKRASQTGNRYLKNVLMTAVSSIAARRVPDNALTQRWQAGVAVHVASDRVRRNLARKVVVLAQYLLRFKEQYNDERVVTTR